MLSRADIKRRKLDMAEDDAEWQIVLDLPQPPSVNRFMKKLGNKSPAVKAWTAEADYQLYAARAARRGTPSEIVPMKGLFEAQFIFQRSSRGGDIDNRVKPLLDWLQRVGLIENDSMCECLICGRGRTPLGVRVRLREWLP
jgi:Holliday junction resolvase RusA-like endonuclease